MRTKTRFAATTRIVQTTNYLAFRKKYLAKKCPSCTAKCNTNQKALTAGTKRQCPVCKKVFDLDNPGIPQNKKCCKECGKISQQRNLKRQKMQPDLWLLNRQCCNKCDKTFDLDSRNFFLLELGKIPKTTSCCTLIAAPRQIQLVQLKD